MAEVLIVEDTILTRTILTNIMRENGHHVSEAVDGNDGVNKYFEIRPDLVLMDLLMPEKDGLTAIKEIMSRDPNAKIIVCTADLQDARMFEAIEAGACEYITKPFDNETVITVTEKCIKSTVLEEMQQDVITSRAIMKDLIKNGIKRSIQALSKMTNKTVKVSISDVSVIPLTDIPDYINTDCIGVNYNFTGDNKGCISLLIHKQDAFEMTKELMQPNTVIDDGVIQSVFNEMGNIYINSFISSFSDLLDISILFGIPDNADQNTLMEKVSDIMFEQQVSHSYIVKGTYFIDSLTICMYLVIYTDIKATTYKYNLQTANNYLIIEPTSVKGFEVFRYMIKRGFKGICMSKKHPDEIRKEIKEDHLPLIWLTNENIDIPNCVCTTNLLKIGMTIQSFYNKANNIILFIDDLKYLVDTKSSGIVNGFIEEIKMISIQNNNILLISCDIDLIEKKVINQKDFEIIKP